MKNVQTIVDADKKKNSLRLVTEEELFEVIKSVNFRYAILLLQSYIQQYGALSDEIEEKIKNYFQDYLMEQPISENGIQDTIQIIEK